MPPLTLRESRLTLGQQLLSYDVTGLPSGHTVIIRQLPAGGWRLLVAKPGKTLEIRGEFLTVEAALARAQLDYDTIVW